MLGIVIFLLSFVFPNTIYAASEKFINIVNPIRISIYNNSPQESIKAQYQVINEADLSATWLLTFDVLDNQLLVDTIKRFNEKQEIGLFLEVSESFAKSASVEYKKEYSWHHAENIFLTGYIQSDRIKLIDDLFAKFKDNFGYYPRSVGGWWIDAYSLNYMQEKYNIVANLGLSDQHSTDGYRVWGTAWGVPFYPSKLHSGIPAGRSEDKISIVTIQWAPRDPLNGYYDSYYSTQDYLQTKEKLDTTYFSNLLNTYLNTPNAFGQITVGLEGDLAKEAYSGEYKNQINSVKTLQKKEDIKVITMTEFAKYFENVNYDDFMISSKDLLGTKRQTVWFSNPSYRLGFIHDLDKGTVEVIDIRSYHNNFQEPYYHTPNYGTNLFINIPSLIDSFSNTSEKITIKTGNLIEQKKSGTESVVKFENGEIELLPDSIVFDFPNDLITNKIGHSDMAVIKENKIVFSKFYGVRNDGYLFKSLSEPAIRLIQRKRTMLYGLMFLFLIFAFIYFTAKSKLLVKIKIYLVLISLGIPLLAVSLWYSKNQNIYYVGQSEIEALERLKRQDIGKVLVYDSFCLGCEWQSPHKPAVFDNKRDYVGKFAKKEIVKNQKIFETADRNKAKDEFLKTGAKYVYLVKYGKYAEKLQFSPGDLDIEKIYDNANSEIWRVKR